MKPYIFFILMILLTWQTASAQTDQQPADCSKTDGCLTYSLNGATRHDQDTYILSFTLIVNCTNRLEYIAFELPEGADADEPSNYYAQQKEFIVHDGKTSGKKIETTFNAIQYTAKNNTNISNGGSFTFEFAINTTDYNALNNIRVQAKVANSAPSLVTFDHRTCAPLADRQMPDCRIDLGQAVVGFTGATTSTSGSTTLGFMIQNNLPEDVQTISIEIPGAPEGVTAVSDNNGSSYQANYKYKTTYTDGILTFEAQNTKGFANGATDQFLFSLPAGTYNPEENFTITMQAGQTMVATGFNTVSCEDSPITPLPVELLSFKGKATQSGIDLQWETASEKDNERFEVERSTDGRTFEKIGQVAGAGNSSIKLNYSYTDPVLRQGVYHYRLRQVDYDGTYAYSKTVAVQLKAVPGSGRFQVYPNPATGTAITVWVAGTGADVNGGSLQIVDMSGKVMFTGPVNAGSRTIDLPLQELRLPKGMYVVNLLQGTDKQTQKLIVQ
ncbi:T9SS type A sorting domain-containing protein [Pontibacter sp. Tf4]|uniref:T9SS type A sorting domain-containing protein n=1 Tax=Pontibacter sp. Tf4 TaxID=2761620 RepID=UPI001627B101|nr:T9SS type A sorting domain-containing protein [Pontibacter sp. Tf4]MBB6611229.1 T9SS type A sorting domain-containing protein [Pontibacter sp. Tf4]